MIFYICEKIKKWFTTTEDTQGLTRLDDELEEQQQAKPWQDNTSKTNTRKELEGPKLAEIFGGQVTDRQA